MIRPPHVPPNTYFDDSASRLDPPTQDEILSIALAGEALHRVFEWTLQGGTEQRSLRFHLVALCLFPNFSLAAVLRQRGAPVFTAFRGNGPVVFGRISSFNSTEISASVATNSPE